MKLTKTYDSNELAMVISKEMNLPKAFGWKFEVVVKDKEYTFIFTEKKENKQ